MDSLRVLLFAMTGFGNNAFNILGKQPLINLSGVFTSKRQVAPFPYYKCEQLHKTVQRCKIPLYEGLSLKDKGTVETIKNLSPDLIVVSSFNQIIPQPIINIPKLGIINIHPSLLPKYRGATPTVWVLLNGEKETGITIHFIENERIDCGRIVSQAKLKIEPDDTDGSIRRKLAKLSEKVLIKAIRLISREGKEIFLGQNEPEAAFYPRRTLKDAEINLDSPFEDIVKKIRAMSPYPGAYLKYKGKKYPVKSVTLLQSKNSGSTPKKNSDELVVSTVDGLIKFDLMKNHKEYKDLG